MNQKNNYTFEDLIECAKGNMFGAGNPQLPMPPMLMFDRITHIDQSFGFISNSALTIPLSKSPPLSSM